MRLLSSFLVLICAAVPCLAQTNTPAANGQQVLRLSLQDCIARALEQNLRLQVTRYLPREARAALGVARAGYDPIFTLSGERSYRLSDGGFDENNIPFPASSRYDTGFSAGLNGTIPSGMTYNLFGDVSETYGSVSDNADGDVGITLTQPLLRGLWIDDIRLSIRIARNEVTSSDLELMRIAEEQIYLVEQTYNNLIAAREDVLVREQALQLAEQLLAENRKRVEVGQMAPLDEKQAESQVASARADLLETRQQVSINENQLRTLISSNYQDFQPFDLEPTGTLQAQPYALDLQESWRRGLIYRKELLKAGIEVLSQRERVRSAFNQVFPSLDAFGTYGHGGGNGTKYSDAFNGFTRGNRPFYTYGLRLSIPLANKRARENYRSSKDAYHRLAAEEKISEQTVLSEIDNAIDQAKASFERVAARRAAREFAQSALNSERKKLENGKSTSFIVLQLQRDLTEASSLEIAARVAYNNALSELAWREGRMLDRHRIDFDVQKEISFETPPID